MKANGLAVVGTCALKNFCPSKAWDRRNEWGGDRLITANLYNAHMYVAIGGAVASICMLKTSAHASHGTAAMQGEGDDCQAMQLARLGDC